MVFVVASGSRDLFVDQGWLDVFCTATVRYCPFNFVNHENVNKARISFTISHLGFAYFSKSAGTGSCSSVSIFASASISNLTSV
jgi:hypothetical protein